MPILPQLKLAEVLRWRHIDPNIGPNTEFNQYFPDIEAKSRSGKEPIQWEWKQQPSC